ncbi:hypothetical protein SISSUDRAFT_469208 [Sistotremastrum suecicum HHB10207 ss-3]|uniref:Uncharacterized protein n=1 Tax=Sistotremastrum suecicum HHB10207 ss-3 TaxID=1314776 RepID=A0A165Y5V7_9AGAM|nr:hypothetical protein SISSUDRAFT_469208 [Sistotremastrum suecicum HHB10207 ss-3]
MLISAPSVICPADPVVSSWNLTSKGIRCTCFSHVGESHHQSSQLVTITNKVLLSSLSLLRLIVYFMSSNWKTKMVASKAS